MLLEWDEEVLTVNVVSDYSRILLVERLANRMKLMEQEQVNTMQISGRQSTHSAVIPIPVSFTAIPIIRTPFAASCRSAATGRSAT